MRIADVVFIRWERFPDGKLPRAPIPALAPDLAIEVLSKGNPEREMRRKGRDYFEAGVRLVWYINSESQTATVYTAADQSSAISSDGVLDGADVLPGFTLSLTELFAKAGPREYGPSHKKCCIGVARNYD